jgi:hypothetical protein
MRMTVYIIIIRIKKLQKSKPFGVQVNRIRIMLKNFKYFTGFTPGNPEQDFINTNHFDIFGLRRSIGSLIDLYIPDSAAEMKSSLEQAANRKRETFVNDHFFINTQHTNFIVILNYYLDIENCPVAVDLMDTYYKVFLVDSINQQDHWIIRSVQNIKDYLDDDSLPF